jgi:hypothetical protein
LFKRKQIVLKDVRNESSEEEKQYLSENLDIWLYFLQITKKDVEFQLASQKAKDKISFKEIKLHNPEESVIIGLMQKQDKWRMGALRFLTAIEKKMLFVKMQLKNVQLFENGV